MEWGTPLPNLIPCKPGRCNDMAEMKAAEQARKDDYTALPGNPAGRHHHGHDNSDCHCPHHEERSVRGRAFWSSDKMMLVLANRAKGFGSDSVTITGTGGFKKQRPAVIGSPSLGFSGLQNLQFEQCGI